MIMRLFSFDPITGTRGKVIRTISLPNYVAIAKHHPPTLIPGFVGVGSPFNQFWQVLRAAGRSGISYQSRTQWLCFCTGEKHGYWLWYILPPKDAFKGLNPVTHAIPLPPLFATRVVPSNIIKV